MATTTTEDLPVVDLAAYLAAVKTSPGGTAALVLSNEARAACLLLAEQLRQVGVAVIRDPRVCERDNEIFLDLMEDYFNQPYEEKLQDARPDIGYQLGVTPDHIELPRCVNDMKCHQMIEKLDPAERPHLPKGPDPKWRYFWRVGERPTETRFPELNAPQVVPKAFSEWSVVMDRWGQLMQHAVETVTEMAALGLGLPVDAIASMARLGPHLLAPTGSDLSRYNQVGTVFAGFHYDLNLLTIHGKSRFPGLFVWQRDGRRTPVRVPDGCLLVQAGKEMEWLTGGAVQAGYHEVVVTERTLAALAEQRRRGRPAWRISSTVFFHVNSDALLRPLGAFASAEASKAYPPILAGDHVRSELETIKLLPAPTAAS